MEEKTKIRVYFDEEWDQLTFDLRIIKKDEREKGFYIEKEKYDWIKKVTNEYKKAQSFISMKLISENLI